MVLAKISKNTIPKTFTKDIPIPFREEQSRQTLAR